MFSQVHLGEKCGLFWTHSPLLPNRSENRLCKTLALLSSCLVDGLLGLCDLLMSVTVVLLHLAEFAQVQSSS